MKDFGKVVVLMGGFHGEREISLNSGKAALAALQKQGVDAHGLDVQADVVERLKALSPDRAFIALHGRWGEAGGMQGVLDMLNIPYTGSDMAASAVAMDKQRTKRIWQAMHLPTPDFLVLHEDSDPQAVVDKLGLPLCIKPIEEGSSLGVTRVSTLAQFRPAYDKAREQASMVMVEPWIEGLEYTVGIVGDRVLPSIQIRTPREFYDFIAKYKEHTTEYLCPSGLDETSEQEIQALALAAYQAIGCRHWGRVDVMRDKNGKFWLIEVNTIPGLTETSLVPKAAKAIGVSFEQLILKLLEMTL